LHAGSELLHHHPLPQRLTLNHSCSRKRNRSLNQNQHRNRN